ncbi:hypothetical protein ACOME3_005427 [Neoechinorhynchus agilis]
MICYSDHSNTEETPNAKGKPGLNFVHQITTLRQAISFARQKHDPYPMPRPVDAAMIQFDATSHDSPITYSDHSNTEETHNAKGKPGLNSQFHLHGKHTILIRCYDLADAAMIQSAQITSHDSSTTYSDHSNTEETPNAKGKPDLNSVHQITTLRQAISFARQAHDPYPMPRPVDAAMIQFDATSHDSPITYSDHSNTEETPNAKGKPGLNSVHQITTLRQAISFARQTNDPYPMPRPVDAAMIQFDATSHDSPTTYSDHSNPEEAPNAKGKPGLNSVHQITTLRQAISFARQTHDPYPMPRPVDAAMIQFDATSHDSPITYSDHSNTEETPNAKGKPGLNSVHQITTLRQAISFARQTHDPYPMPRPADAAMIQFDATSHDSPITYSDHSNTEETPNAKGKPGLNSVHQITTLRQAIAFARQTHDPYPMPRPVDAAMIQYDATSHDSPITYRLNSVHQIITLRQAILFARQTRDPYPMPRPVDAAMIQFDATSHDSPTTYSDHSNTEETPNAKGKPGLNSVHQITTWRQAISFVRQTHDPYPMPRPVDAAMIQFDATQFDATSPDSPTTYSDHSNTEETPNAKGKPDLNSFHQITTLRQAISFDRQTHDPYPL